MVHYMNVIGAVITEIIAISLWYFFWNPINNFIAYLPIELAIICYVALLVMIIMSTIVIEMKMVLQNE